MARRDGNAAVREWNINNKRGARLDERGHRDARKYYRLEEVFPQLPALNAASVLATTPTAAAFAAALAANKNFEHLGTNTEVVTFANKFDFGGGIKVCTATADADSAIIQPNLVAATDLALGQTGWAVAQQWASHRSPRFECVITPTPASQITTVALTSNIALITTGAAHGLFPGESVTIKLDAADSDYSAVSSLEGTWVVQSVATTTTFTFAYTHANIVSASIAGSCIQATNQVSGAAGLAITNIDLTTNVVTITTAYKHGLAANCIVEIAIDQTSAAFLALNAANRLLLLALQGTQTVTSAYSASATTFTYSKTAADITTGAFTGLVKETALNASLTKTMICAGFKKTNDPVVPTDDDQCFLRFNSCVSATPTGAVSAYWQFITSRAGVDTVTELTNIAPPSMGTTYRIEIAINSDRIPSLWINGQSVEIGTGKAALSPNIDFIPYVEVAASGIVPAAKAITLEYIACDRKSDRSAA